MRILHLHDRAVLLGGAERAVCEAARALAERGHESDLLLPDGPSALQRGRADREFLGAEAPRRVADEGGFRRTGALSRGREGHEIAAWIRSERPDLILVHNLRGLPGRAAFGELPLIRMVHDLSPTCPRGTRVRRFGGRACHRMPGLACTACLAFLERRPDAGLGLGWRSPSSFADGLRELGGFDALVAPSAMVAERLVELGLPKQRIHRVPLGLDWEAAPGTPRGRLLLVGSLVRGKGFDRALRAIARERELLRRRLGPDFGIDIVGAGPDAQALAGLARRLDLGSRLRLHGRVEGPALARLYAAAELLLFPSTIPEAFGLVGLEAMASGRAVVATPSGGVREWLLPQETGELARDASVSGLAAALADALAYPGLPEVYGAAGRRRYEREFTRQAFGGRLEAALLRCAQGAVESGEVVALP